MNKELVFKDNKLKVDYKLNKVNYNNLGMIGNSRRENRINNDEKVSTLLMILLLLLLTFLLFKVILNGIDDGLERKERMLCESAKISRNKGYLERCKCFYQTNNIKCLQE